MKKTALTFLFACFILNLAHATYDPTVGRFLTRDPIGENGGTNLYAYVLNNPINSIDPLGLDNLNLVNRSRDFVAYRTGNVAPLDPNEYSVQAHGSQYGLYDSKEMAREYTAKEVADMIKADPDYIKNPRPIRLNACYTGKDDTYGPPNFARQLSKLMNQQVIAPTDDLVRPVSLLRFITGWGPMPPAKIANGGTWAKFGTPTRNP